eukprot:5252324-Pyramimonas_sp.AAC.1
MPTSTHSLCQLAADRRDRRPYRACATHPSHEPPVVLCLITPDVLRVEGGLPQEVPEKIVLVHHGPFLLPTVQRMPGQRLVARGILVTRPLQRDALGIRQEHISISYDLVHLAQPFEKQRARFHNVGPSVAVLG